MAKLPPIGSHMSIAGGVDKAPARAAKVGCTAMQIFVKNNNRWVGPPITPEQAKNFAVELDKAGIPIEHVFAHTCYLINLATEKPENLAKSIEAMVDELERCAQLDLPGLVMHPGSHMGQGRDVGIAQIADSLQKIFDRTPKVKTRVLLETTAGTGHNLGAEFEDLRDIMQATARPDRLGVCLDTCHIFAAGHDIRDEASWKKTMKHFADTVGFENLFAVHVNDSMRPFASRKDRHEHIGKGEIGEEAFRLLMTDKRFAKIPMALETEKGDDLAEDRENLATLYRLAGVEYPA